MAKKNLVFILGLLGRNEISSREPPPSFLLSNRLAQQRNNINVTFNSEKK